MKPQSRKAHGSNAARASDGKGGLSVREGTLSDLDELARFAAALWPEDDARGHRKHLRAILSGNPRSTLPLTVHVAARAGRLVGFVEVGLRSHADGCDERRPVGFLEGWWVEPDERRRGVGRALVDAAESWARRQGCREMASDTWIDEAPSIRAHQSIGYEVVDRCVHFRKSLTRPRKSAR
jgi:aminoglycoside 6'-N-acetyltransferase I